MEPVMTPTGTLLVPILVSQGDMLGDGYVEIFRDSPEWDKWEADTGVTTNKKGGDNCGIGPGGFTKGNKCAVDGGVPKGKSKEPVTATPAELKKAEVAANKRIADAPVPTKDRVKFNRVRLNRHKKAVKEWDKGGRVGAKPKQREFLDLRGNTKQREARREKLFKEFGGEEKGYVVCHGNGTKMHHTADKKKNPKGYPVFEEGKIFTAYQGGGYHLSNLIPESPVHNLGRGNDPVRPENLK